MAEDTKNTGNNDDGAKGASTAGADKAPAKGAKAQVAPVTNAVKYHGKLYEIGQEFKAELAHVEDLIEAGILEIVGK